ncbi:hypothetical protein ABZY34_13500 [Streptomyces virginiae]|uniref:hypothetical protein n=1 Tax=Streptomyces virginiae TaxID=1961 RepID=UPI0033BC8ED5
MTTSRRRSGGTTASPEFDRAAVVARLLATARSPFPGEAPSVALVVAGGGGTRRFRLEDPHLFLADDAEDEESLSGWSTNEDANAPAAPAGKHVRADRQACGHARNAALTVLGEASLILAWYVTVGLHP